MDRKLHNDSDGILGTHVTWEDIENVLIVNLGTDAKFGLNKKATNIGEMKGFMSKMILIEPDWCPESSKLPQKFALKISSSQSIINFSKSIKTDDENGLTQVKIKRFDELCQHFHNREVDAYQFFTKNQDKIDFPILKSYGSQKFCQENFLKAFLIFEYVENFKSLHRYENLEIEQILPIVKGIAEFSALAELSPKIDLQFAGNCEIFQQLLTEFVDQNSSCQLFRESFPENMRNQVEQLIEVYQFLMAPEQVFKISRISKFFGYFPQLVHGDLWPGNLLFSKTSMELRAIIDFQTISFGSPAQDLTRLFISTLSAKTRRGYIDYLLEHYYKHFVANLKEIPYTLKQLKLSYQLMFPTMGLMLLPGILRFSSLSPDLSLKKAIDIMNDVLEIHCKNLDEFREFFN